MHGFSRESIRKKFLDKLGKEAGWGLVGMEGWELEGAGWAGWAGCKKLKKNKNEKAEKVKSKR